MIRPDEYLSEVVLASWITLNEHIEFLTLDELARALRLELTGKRRANVARRLASRILRLRRDAMLDRLDMTLATGPRNYSSAVKEILKEYDTP